MLDFKVKLARGELGNVEVERMPDNLIKLAIHDAVGRRSDKMLKTSAVAYFVGRMKKVAKEQGIDLGFK